MNSQYTKAYIETYGCQMNFSDSEIVARILYTNNISITSKIGEADILLLNTCAIREKPEISVINRLRFLKRIKKNKPHVIIGVLGCLAEKLKDKLLQEENLADLVCGPDSYRDLLTLIDLAKDNRKAINVLLSREETYADITPLRLSPNKLSAYISIMRGCNNMCTFCVVPFTRGRERSRSPDSIISEIEGLVKEGYKEITLLGQNVDSYNYNNVNFATLLDMIASTFKNLRIRFATSHPKDMTINVLETIASHPNICKYIHLPCQSGSNNILAKMKRGYTREHYLSIIKNIRNIIGENCGISTDIIAGFCGETEDDHKQTLSLMEEVRFHYAYTFKYSERPGTYAARFLKDDVPPHIKTKRLNEIIELQRHHSLEWNKSKIGQVVEVLVENTATKSDNQLMGRTSENFVVVFPKKNNVIIGNLVNVKINACTSATLIGEIV